MTETLPVRAGQDVGAPRGLTEDGRLKSGRLAGLTMWGAVWVLSWPIMLESFLNSLVGLVDTKLAAGFGVEETDAIGGASYIMWFIGLVIMALGIGATALIARAVGKGRMGVANAILGQTLLLALLAGAAVGVLVYFASPMVASSLGMTPGASEAFQSYMSIIAIAAPAAAVLFALIACARGAGDSKRPLIAMIVRNIVNIVASWALSGYETVPGQNPFSFDLGITGIALGTMIADVVGALVILFMAGSGVWGIRLKARWLRPHWHTLRRIVRLGAPNFLETFGMWIGNFFIILMVGWIARDDIARGGSGGQLGAHIIGIRIEAFSFLPGFAMGSAAATLAGQYLGAGSKTMAKLAVWRCTMLAAAVMGLLGASFVLFSRELTAALSDQQEHLEMVPDLLVICGVVQIPFALAIVFRSAMRGAGDVKTVMWLTWFSTYAIRLPAALLLSGASLPVPGWLIALLDPVDGAGMSTIWIPNPSGLDPSLSRLWYALCGELVVRCVIFSLRFAQGRWLSKSV